MFDFVNYGYITIYLAKTLHFYPASRKHESLYLCREYICLICESIASPFINCAIGFYLRVGFQYTNNKTFTNHIKVDSRGLAFLLWSCTVARFENLCLILILILLLKVHQVNVPYLFPVCIICFPVLVPHRVEVLEPVPPFWTIPVRLAAQDLGSNHQGFLSR